MHEANEFASQPRLTSQRSLSAVDSLRRSLCCIGGGHCSKSFTELELHKLCLECRGFFSTVCGGHMGGGNTDNIRNSNKHATYDDADGSSDDNDDLYNKAPLSSRCWVFFRKVKAEARRNMRWRSATSQFHYDALSYAMNFDDGSALIENEEDEGRVEQLRLHSMRFSGPVAVISPVTILSPA